MPSVCYICIFKIKGIHNELLNHRHFWSTQTAIKYNNKQCINYIPVVTQKIMLRCITSVIGIWYSRKIFFKKDNRFHNDCDEFLSNFSYKNLNLNIDNSTSTYLLYQWTIILIGGTNVWYCIYKAKQGKLAISFYMLIRIGTVGNLRQKILITDLIMEIYLIMPRGKQNISMDEIIIVYEY